MSKPESGRKYIVWEPLLLALMVALGMMLGNKMKLGVSPAGKDSVGKHQQGAVEDILRYIETRYVDIVDSDALTEVAINAILNELDPHSQYLSAERRQYVEEEMSGEYVGVGIEKLHLDSSIVVVRTFPGSAALENGILPGDILLTLNDTVDLTRNIAPDSLQYLLRGEPGTTARVTVKKLDGVETTFDLTRSPIELSTIDHRQMLNDSLGYIRINRFAANTYKEFMRAVEDLVQEGLDDLVIDVRGNPGGFLQEVVKILDQLVSSKESLLVYTEGYRSKKMEYQSTGRNFYDLDDIVVLIDGNSASASEILAGSLQDLDRALVIGSKSFGKGLVQEQYPLSNGAAIRLTTARYFTPSGRLIQKQYQSGEMIERTVDELSTEYDLALGDSQIDSTEHTTANGRRVEAGGGIMPDIEVQGTSGMGPTERAHLIYYTLCFTAENYGRLQEKYYRPEVDVFIDKCVIDETDLGDLVMYLKKEWPEGSYDNNLDELHDVLKAHLGRMMFNDASVSNRVEMSHDETLKMAIEVVERNEVDLHLLNTAPTPE